MRDKRIGKKSQGKYDNTNEDQRQHNQQTNTYDEIYKKRAFYIVSYFRAIPGINNVANRTGNEGKKKKNKFL
jgi:hypothetical protein